MSPSATWREDIDALQFAAVDHGGVCMVHRLAFRSLLGRPPDREACLAYFTTHAAAFVRAAATKIARQSLAPGRNFHLDSRDVRRALADIGEDAAPASARKGHVPACRILVGTDRRQP